MGDLLPFLLVVIVGMISTFSKIKGQNQGNQGKRAIPPQLDPMHPKHFEGKQQRNQEVLDQQPVKLEPKPILFEETTFRGELRETIEGAPSPRLSPKERSDEISTDSLKKLNTRKLMEGVIMAEVLGPPRALKPHPIHQTKRLPK